MTNSKKISYLLFCASFISFIFTATGTAQDRPRVVKSTSSRPINQLPTPADTADKTRSLTSSIPSNSRTIRPLLTNNLIVAQPAKTETLVKKTAASSPMHAAAASLAAGRLTYSGSISSQIMLGIESRLGIPYRYGSTGPKTYDCSGFVWSVFNEAGVNFTRQSARSLWAMSQTVEGDERFKFGTLVFLNGLGHIGIVADENGFYHASSSKGVTYSTFKGYWEKHIVGYRRLVNTPMLKVVPEVEKAAK